jgi:Xaa-Pro aminopeptidase
MCCCRDFYCHSVGHYLGLDVHDTNTIGPYRTLEPGVVLAVEPGLYIPDHPQFGPYAGIGVRIEDDVLITQTGCEVGVAAGSCLLIVWRAGFPSHCLLGQAVPLTGVS